jgi:hypothetical protein
MAVSREKLYEEVWQEPMITVAVRYCVSSSFLARICERLNVPDHHEDIGRSSRLGRRMQGLLYLKRVPSTSLIGRGGGRHGESCVRYRSHLRKGRKKRAI